MNKRKSLNSNDSDEEKEEKENSKVKKSSIKDDKYTIKLSKNIKKNEQEGGENISEQSNSSFKLFFDKKNNDNKDDVKSLKGEIQKLKTDNLEKDKIIEKLTNENNNMKKYFSEYNRKMKFKEDEIQLLNCEYEKLLKEHDII